MTRHAVALFAARASDTGNFFYIVAHAGRPVAIRQRHGKDAGMHIRHRVNRGGTHLVLPIRCNAM
jgi:hypothetical protein